MHVKSLSAVNHKSGPGFILLIITTNRSEDHPVYGCPVVFYYNVDESQFFNKIQYRVLHILIIPKL